MTFEASEPTDQLRERGQAISKRRTDRRAMSSWAVPESYAAKLSAHAAHHGVVADLLTGSQLEAWKSFAEQADHRRVVPAYREELYDWTHRPESANDGIPATNRVSIDEPETTSATRFPPGDLTLPAHSDTPPEPVSLLLTTSSDDMLARLRTGEALSAVLLEATRLGLSTAIDTQALELDATRSAVESELLGGLRTPQVLVTVGWPAGSGHVPPTPRREVGEILTTTAPPTPTDDSVAADESDQVE